MKNGRGPRAEASPRVGTTSGMLVDPQDVAVRSFLAGADLLARYHRHRVVGMEHLTRRLLAGRRVVVVGNHALDVVDPLLFCAEVYRRTGRAPRFVAHENGWFRVPLLREVARRFRVIPSRRPSDTLAALQDDGFLMLYPGSNREAALRSYREEPYRLKWEGRTGYLRMALEGAADLLFVSAIGSDEAYFQTSLAVPRAVVGWVNAGDDRRYAGARLRVGLAGVHLIPGVVPLPVRMTHVLGAPICLGDRARARRDPDAFAELHRRVWKVCQDRLDESIRERDRHSDGLDRALRGLEGWLQRLGV